SSTTHGRRVRSRRRLAHARPARSGTGTESADFRRAQAAGTTTLELVEPDRADPDTHQTVDRGADRSEHPAQLSLPALRQDRPIPDEVAGRWREEVDQATGLDVGRRSEGGEGRESL